MSFPRGFAWRPKSGVGERKWLLEVRAAGCKICGIMMFNYGNDKLLGRIASKIDVTKRKVRH